MISSIFYYAQNLVCLIWKSTYILGSVTLQISQVLSGSVQIYLLRCVRDESLFKLEGGLEEMGDPQFCF